MNLGTKIRLGMLGTCACVLGGVAIGTVAYPHHQQPRPVMVQQDAGTAAVTVTAHPTPSASGTAQPASAGKATRVIKPKPQVVQPAPSRTVHRQVIVPAQPAPAPAVKPRVAVVAPADDPTVSVSPTPAETTPESTLPTVAASAGEDGVTRPPKFSAPPTAPVNPH